MDSEASLYNSKIIKVYLEYLNKHHPDTDVDSVLNYAGITRYEVEDSSHWFSQRQVDRFYEILVGKTNNPNIAREAGRYIASSEGLGAAKQYALGLMSLPTIYLLMGRIYPILSRGSTVKAKKLGSNKIEIVSTPKAGVNEKPYQCENWMGTFEALGIWFTDRYASLEHPGCIHTGDECCRYIVTWEKTIFSTWKRIRNLIILLSILLSGTLLFTVPFMTWILIFQLCGILILTVSYYALHLEKRNLAKTVETQGNAAEDLLDEMNIRYQNALLTQEIGQATSTLLDINVLIRTVLSIMKKHLDFDRGMIMISDKEKRQLVYAAGYGYDQEKEALLQKTEFHLNKPEAKGLFVLAFKRQNPYLVNDVAEIENSFSKRSQDLIQKMGVQALICVPIVYEGKSLGILTVDNVESKRPLTKSDMNLLMGVASQTAASITNATSFWRLQESEKKYRDLVENANSIILRTDSTGSLTFFNEYAQNFFGYTEKEILGKNVIGSILPDTGAVRDDLRKRMRILRRNPERQLVSENKSILKNGDSVWIAWTYKPIFSKGEFAETLCIGNDITELKKADQEREVLEVQLQQAQKMEAIGTLAGGIAHDFNNILSAIIGYAEISIDDVPEGSLLHDNLQGVLTAGYRASDLIKQILTFSRQTKHEQKPVNVKAIVKEALKLIKASLPATIEIRQNIQGEAIVMADSTQIHQILMNLCTNADHAMRETGGVLDISLKKVQLDSQFTDRYPDLNPGSYCQLTVSDDGKGMSHRVKERIFEPFYTTKARGEGTGMGLSVIHGIVKEYKGTITVESERGKGSSFSVYFPIVEREEEETKKPEKKIPKGQERILFIDDDETIVKVAQQILKRLGYKVTVKTRALDALELFRKQPHKFDLVISDMIMPKVTGDILARELTIIRPDIPIIICTGYPSKIPDEKAKTMPIKALLKKPLSKQQIAETVRNVLDGVV